ncbi:MAG: hypothetical protein ACRDQA_24095 [Nocardioidaceae bacterium]
MRRIRPGSDTSTARELHAGFADWFRDLGNGEWPTTAVPFCRTVPATSRLQDDEVEQAVHVAEGVVEMGG